MTRFSGPFTDDDTVPARAMLEQEGFRYEGYVDIFDAGPTVECFRDNIDAIKGKGAMPPKGGNMSLPDADVKAAVDYMVAGSK